jgi:2-amino-4-hydroxy-6-hydroxymethyldihydropteridine diphosphokinase
MILPEATIVAMTTVAIALGTNVGDRLGHLQRAVDALRSVVNLVAVSRVYETAPMYVEDQPAFLNAAVSAVTDLGPLPLLQTLKQIEATSGRQQRERYGPREIDLDLVVYGAASYRYRSGHRTILEVPHPRTAERRFVLAPLLDLGLIVPIPGFGLVSDLFEATNSQAATVIPLVDAFLSL